MPYGSLADGEAVLFVDARGRRYLKRLRRGHRITIRASVIAADSVIGAPEGSVAGAGERESFRVFRPSLADLVPNLARPAEPVFAKDAGLVLLRGDIRPGDHVIEVGVGAGALTIALVRAVGPEGRVTSYELRPDFAATAQANVEMICGRTPAWTVKVRDALEGFDEQDVDRIVTDVPDPASLIDVCAASLRCGGTLVSYVPTVLQFKELRDRLADHRSFGCEETYEVLERSWHVEGRSVRPDHRMVAHTGFLTFARRLAD
jgi:tRNA (adenine57-N1/adenine58-N1)-methyltransferase